MKRSWPLMDLQPQPVMLIVFIHYFLYLFVCLHLPVIFCRLKTLFILFVQHLAQLIPFPREKLLEAVIRVKKKKILVTF